MKCPRCKVELVPGEPQEYQNTAEHVMDPNRESYPLRAGWVCPASGCPLAGGFWDHYGEHYLSAGEVTAEMLRQPTEALDSPAFGWLQAEQNRRA